MHYEYLNIGILFSNINVHLVLNPFGWKYLHLYLLVIQSALVHAYLYYVWMILKYFIAKLQRDITCGE